MDLLFQANGVKMLGRMLDRSHATEVCIPYHPQKVAFGGAYTDSQPFEEVTPESVGLSSRMLCDFYRALEDDPTLDLHTVGVYRNGKRLCLGNFGCYRQDIWHITHSLCKSITGLAVGSLIAEGRLSLEDKITKIFEKKASPLAMLGKKNMTVRHLLTMSTGVVFNEVGAVTETDWVRAYLESGTAFESGSAFSYNSMNTYMLSALVKEITGESLCDYLRPRLFEPMGVTRFHWETCPMGIEKGGFGLYMMPEDMVKFGQLYLDGGKWHGKQLIPEEWIREATTPRMTAPASYGDFNYGYHVWVGRKADSILLNGMLGQNVLCWRPSGIIVSTTGSNPDFFQQSRYFKHTETFFDHCEPKDQPLPPDPEGVAQLRALCARLRPSRHRPTPLVNAPALPEPPRSRSFWTGLRALFTRRDRAASGAERSAAPLPPECMALQGRALCLPPEETRNVGLLPHMIQMVQNNYTKGLNALSFAVSGDTFFLTFEEEGEAYTLPVGMNGVGRETELFFGGEPYRVGTEGRFAKDEYGADVLLVRISFLEAASAREVRIRFHAAGADVTLDETPGGAFILETGYSIIGETKYGKLVEGVLGKLDRPALESKVLGAFCADLKATWR